MLEPANAKGPFTMLYQLTWDDWVQHLTVWKHEPWTAWDTHQGGYVLALAMAFLLPMARTLLRVHISEPLARRVLPRDYKKTDSDEIDPGLLAKFNEAAWKAAFYAMVLVVGFNVIKHEKFVTDTTYFWRGCNQFPPCNYSVPLLLRFLYSMELGFYVQAVPYLIFWEVRRKDFWENFGHHIATIGLIVYSYEVNFMKIGVMVFLCHDINDVFMETAKMSKYAKREWLANSLFAMFVISWFVSRMFYFPFWIIRSAIYEPNLIIADVYNISAEPHQTIFLCLLCFLLLLHTYWSFLILRIVYNTLTKGETSDIRETEAPVKVKTSIKQSPVKASDSIRQLEKEAPGIRSP